MGPLEAELAGLQELTIHHLRILWRRVHGGAIEPPAPFTRDLLARAIAYRMQEQVHGGLAPAARRRLRALARVLDSGDGDAIDPGVPLRPGTRLLRDWGGKTHTPLAFLAPDIVEAIAAGRHPPELTAHRLIRTVDLPIAWAAQKQLLGLR